MSPERKQKRIFVPADIDHTGQLLEDYYEQFVEWANHLTRGDQAKAQDLVHDFCLHLAVTRPDLSSISSLDGYLYKSLRNIYLSILARSSREALQVLSVADYDSMQLAFAPRGTGDLLQLQNDLRRICFYSLWRKDQTKIASYFILRFFHGYQQHEIADMVGSPIAVLYAKLREFRVEMRAYLRDPLKTRFLGLEKPPVPVDRKSPVSSIELFRELRQVIHAARTGDCLPEEMLIGKYSSATLKPLSTTFLAHIVSCERCLNIVDRFFERPTLDKRGPLDDDDVSDRADARKNKAAKDARAKMLASVQRLRNEVLGHRPRMLSIAVDGKVVASHTIRSQRDILTARLEWPSEVGFVEVFSEQGVRLAQLSVDPLPPEGPHQRLQHVDLTDDRWLELRLTFDGLGLGCEAVYFDAALSAGWWVQDMEAEEFVTLLPREQLWNAARSERSAKARALCWLETAQKTLLPITPSPIFAWSFVMAAAVGVAGYLVLNNEQPKPALSARDVLKRSIEAEAVSLRGKTEHQVLRFEETSSQGEIRQQGTIEVWRDGDGKRYVRRFYDVNHHMLAAEWEQSNGRHGEFSSSNGLKQGKKNTEDSIDDLWKQYLSANAYHVLNEDNAHVRLVDDGYELTVTQPETARPELISATLTFDRSLHPIREVFQVRNGNRIREARFIQADYEREPSNEVPDTVFAPPEASLDSNEHRTLVENSPRATRSIAIASDVELSQMYIAVLYQLNNLNADTSDPIEVERTADRRIRVEGMLPNRRRKQEILAGLNLLANRQLLDLHLMSPEDAPRKRVSHAQPITERVSSFDMGQAEAPADAALRTVFRERGIAGPMLDETVRGFSHDILAHAQAALQHASTLDRLGSGVNASALRAVDFESQEHWTALVAQHARALDSELQAINDQLARISTNQQAATVKAQAGAMAETPEQFAVQAKQVQTIIRSLDRTVGSLFASGQIPDGRPLDIESLVLAVSKNLPLQEAANIKLFSAELKASGTTALLNRQLSRHDTHIR